MPSPPRNITNKKFNDLTGIKFVNKRKQGKAVYHFWQFKCKCGKIKILNKNSVMGGSIKSCGCSRESKKWKKANGYANLIKTYYYYKSSANKRNYEWNLTKEQFEKLTKMNCYYCNSKPSNIMNNKNCNKPYKYQGIDRVNNKKGYTLKNCVPCCKICNRAKGNLTQKAFKKWINNFIVEYV